MSRMRADCTEENKNERLFFLIESCGSARNVKGRVSSKLLPGLDQRLCQCFRDYNSDNAPVQSA